MNKILAKRYAFCDFSKIVGFPNPVPSRDEWERSIPRFRGEEWEIPAEHLLDFHDCMHRLQVMHEDVQIRLFSFSLEGIARDWCRSLPIASISSLADFHAAFNSFCKDYFPAEHLFEECCNEFSLLHKDSDSHENQFCDKASIAEDSIFHEDQKTFNNIDYDSSDTETSDIILDVSIVLNNHEDQHVPFEYSDVKEKGDTSAEDISYCDRGIADPHYDNHGDAFDIVPNASVDLGCYEDQIVPFENPKDNQQIGISAGDSFRSAVNTKGNHQLSVLQTKGNCSRNEEEDDEHKSLDQQLIMHASPAEVQQSTFNIEIREGSQQHHFSLQSEQNLEEVFLCYFIDPIADFLESLSSIKIKIFLSDEDCFYHFFRTHLCWLHSFIFGIKIKNCVSK
jgi:hypothetical protein